MRVGDDTRILPAALGAIVLSDSQAVLLAARVHTGEPLQVPKLPAVHVLDEPRWLVSAPP